MDTHHKPNSEAAGWHRLIHTPQREAAETMEIHPVPIDRALRMARTGHMRDGRSALALLWSESYLK